MPLGKALKKIPYECLSGYINKSHLLTPHSSKRVAQNNLYLVVKACKLNEVVELLRQSCTQVYT
jgi:hypothetical protein